jgi:NADH-ubiquinone oxidoreductase chain 1
LVEGESELVSGFNIEYRAGPFAIIFIAEYTRIIAISIFTSALFLTSSSSLFLILKTLLITTIFL